MLEDIHVLLDRVEVSEDELVEDRVTERNYVCIYLPSSQHRLNNLGTDKEVFEKRFTTQKEFQDETEVINPINRKYAP